MDKNIILCLILIPLFLFLMPKHVQTRNLTQGIEFYLDQNPHGGGNNFCPLSSNYVNFTFCGIKILKLSQLIPYPYHTQIGSWAMIGLWAVYAGENYKFVDDFVTISANQTGYTLCTSMMTPLQRAPGSMRYLGNPHPNLPGLSLFQEYSEGMRSGHAGPYGEEIYVDGSRNFGGSLKVTFWAFTGYENWTLFSLPNFGGEAICLGHPEPKSQYQILSPWGWGNFTSTNVTRVGSVRLGCKKDSLLVPKYGDPIRFVNGTTNSTRLRDEGPGLMTVLGDKKTGLNYPRNVALENTCVFHGHVRALEQCMGDDPPIVINPFSTPSSGCRIFSGFFILWVFWVLHIG